MLHVGVAEDVLHMPFTEQVVSAGKGLCYYGHIREGHGTRSRGANRVRRLSLGKSLSLRVEFSQRVGGSIRIPGKIRRIFGLEQDIHQHLRTLLGSRVDRTGATDTYEQRSKDSEPCFQRCSCELVPLVIAWLVW